MGKADDELIDSQTEASKVLEAALQQMDGFINGKLIIYYCHYPQKLYTLMSEYSSIKMKTF